MFEYLNMCIALAAIMRMFVMIIGQGQGGFEEVLEVKGRPREWFDTVLAKIVPASQLK